MARIIAISGARQATVNVCLFIVLHRITRLLTAGLPRLPYILAGDRRASQAFAFKRAARTRWGVRRWR